MDWKALKNNQCPDCHSTLRKEAFTHECSNCRFVIGNRRFDELVNAIYKKPNKYKHLDDDNLSELNNL